MSQFDASTPCLCCNTSVLIRSVDWGPKVVAMCMSCYNSTPLSIIRVLFLLRSQIFDIYMKLNEIQGHMSKLVSDVEGLLDGG